MIEMVGIDKIKDQKEDGYDRIVDAIFKKWISGGGQKTEMPAEQNKTADVPAHDKHTNGYADNGGADSIYIAKVFRRQVQGIRAECFHKRTVYRAEQDKPEKQEHLVFPEMQKQQVV